MIVRKFVHWSENAPASARAEGIGALARAYLYGDIDGAERAEAERILYAMLDDPSPLVRRALAESLASSHDAPPAIVVGLALDQSDVASVVLSRSPLLIDAQLIDCASVGDAAAQAAIALRAELSPAVSAALAEIAGREAMIALAINEGANLPEFAMRRMIERFGTDGELREALLSRPWLPASIRAALAAAAARQLADYAVERNWLSKARSERVAKDARERAAMIIAAGCAAFSEETAALAAYLRVSGQLTPGLALRALLCGQTGLFAATLVELTGVGPRRVAGLIGEPASTGFAALYARAGLPKPLMVAFRAALVALSREGHDVNAAEEGGLRLPVIQAVLAKCEEAQDESLSRLVALLRRFEADAARAFGTKELARLRVEQVESFAPPVVPQDIAAAIAAAEPAEPVGAVEPMTEQLAETDVVVDLVALEKELLAA